MKLKVFKLCFTVIENKIHLDLYLIRFPKINIQSCYLFEENWTITAIKKRNPVNIIFQFSKEAHTFGSSKYHSEIFPNFSLPTVLV